jgi:hypothetical protein
VATVATVPWAVLAATEALAVRPLALVSTAMAAKVAWAGQVAMEPWAVTVTAVQTPRAATAARPQQNQEQMVAPAATVAQVALVASAAQPVEPVAKRALLESAVMGATPAARAMGATAAMGFLARISTRSADPEQMAAKVAMRAS